MLSIGVKTLEEFDAAARPSFVVRLHEILNDKYPHFLPRFPRRIGLRITDHMLQRAEREGLRYQSSLLAWCELMIIVAADFERAPEVRRVLDENRARRDFLVPDLPDIISDDVWERCEAAGSSLPFFHSAALDHASLAERTAAAIGLALGDRIERGTGAKAADQAIANAQRLRLSEVSDAPLVLAACRMFYPTPGTWFEEVLRQSIPARAKIELIRLRLAIDHGRVV